MRICKQTMDTNFKPFQLTILVESKVEADMLEAFAGYDETIPGAVAEVEGVTGDAPLPLFIYEFLKAVQRAIQFK